MEFKVNHGERFVEVKGKGIELTYIILYGDKFGNELNTSYGVVNEVGVQPSKGTVDYWIKVGRGKLRNDIQELINSAEAFLADNGFIISGTKPAYRR